MAGFPAEPYVRTYVRDNRSVWLQELNLPPARPARAARLSPLERAAGEPLLSLRLLQRQLLDPGARCDRPRDRRRHPGSRPSRMPTGTTYRFHTQRLTANDPLIYTGASLSRSGRGVDRPISAWEEMFLPLALRDHVRQGDGDAGRTERKVPLVTERAHALRVHRAPATRRAAIVAPLVSAGRRRRPGCSSRCSADSRGGRASDASDWAGGAELESRGGDRRAWSWRGSGASPITHGIPQRESVPGESAQR